MGIMNKLTNAQLGLYMEVVRNPGETVGHIGKGRRDSRCDEVDLTKRLFLLRKRGLVWCDEKRNGGYLYKRLWYPIVP